MKRTTGFLCVVLMAAGLGFSSVPAAEAQLEDPVSMAFALLGIPNAWMTVSKPIWQITQDGTAFSVQWEDHAPNPRFAIYRGGDPRVSAHVVLDKETGLVWARDANKAAGALIWMYAVDKCREQTLANRRGWRLPTADEQSSLLDPSSEDGMPPGHPFINVQGYYWTSTTYSERSDFAYIVRIEDGWVTSDDKSAHALSTCWPVRGGTGYATGNW